MERGAVLSEVSAWLRPWPPIPIPWGIASLCILGCLNIRCLSFLTVKWGSDSTVRKRSVRGVQNGAGALAMLCEGPAAAEVAHASPAPSRAHHFTPGAGHQHGRLQLFTGSPELSSPM